MGREALREGAERTSPLALFPEGAKRERENKDLLKGCVQFFIMNYVGNYDYLMDDFKVVSIELRKDLNLLKEYEYYEIP